jgi:hypothetical protein
MPRPADSLSAVPGSRTRDTKNPQQAPIGEAGSGKQTGRRIDRRRPIRSEDASQPWSPEGVELERRRSRTRQQAGDSGRQPQGSYSGMEGTRSRLLRELVSARTRWYPGAWAGVWEDGLVRSSPLASFAPHLLADLGHSCQEDSETVGPVFAGIEEAGHASGARYLLKRRREAGDLLRRFLDGIRISVSGSASTRFDVWILVGFSQCRPDRRDTTPRALRRPSGRRCRHGRPSSTNRRSPLSPGWHSAPSLS